MTDREAVEELAKSLNHLENAMDAAESDQIKAKAGRTYDHLTDTINQTVTELGEDDSVLYEHR